MGHACLANSNPRPLFAPVMTYTSELEVMIIRSTIAALCELVGVLVSCLVYLGQQGV